MTTTERETNLSCADRVAPHWQSRRNDLIILYGFADYDEKRIYLTNEGIETGAEDFERIDDIILEARSTYALAFGYVEPDTFTDQPEGYFRYQISWGGPSDEIRFYVNLDGSCHQAEYWFLDWGDGASLDVTKDEVARAVFQDFAEIGAIKLPE